MKICIISVVAPRLMSMYSVYTDFFKKNNVEYDLIYLDRFSATDFTEAKNVFRFNVKNANSTVSRYWHYLKFPFYCKKIVKKEKYDFLIIWNELTGALLKKLLTSYKGKYILNIRDLFDERKIILYSVLTKKQNVCIKNSLITTLSSKKYIDYLPKSDKYVFFHSLNSQLHKKDFIVKRSFNYPIKIMYMGNIRYVDILEQFLLTISNNPKLQMIIAGSGSDQLKGFCLKHNINNVSFIGAFKFQETCQIINTSDAIYNLYGTENNCLKTALSQKLYLAISSRKPILVFKGTYMSEEANKCGLAFDFSDSNFKQEEINEFINWISSLNFESIDHKCNIYEKNILKENQRFSNLLNQIFIKNEE